MAQLLSPFQPFVEKLCARSALGTEEREALLGLPVHPVQVSTNSDFVRLGEQATHSCLVIEGLVGRFGQNREGGRQITALHIPGDMADLHSVVVPEARSALQALSVTTILKVPHDALRNIAQHFPAIAEAFWRECVIDAAILSEWVVNVGRRDAISRISHLLCEMACRCQGTRMPGHRDYDFAATQSHMADMLGLTPVHVNRTLMALRARNVVAIRGRRVTIGDWDELVRIGDFDPTYLMGAVPDSPARLMAA